MTKHFRTIISVFSLPLSQKWLDNVLLLLLLPRVTTCKMFISHRIKQATLPSVVARSLTPVSAISIPKRHRRKIFLRFYLYHPFFVFNVLLFCHRYFKAACRYLKFTKTLLKKWQRNNARSIFLSWVDYPSSQIGLLIFTPKINKNNCKIIFHMLVFL